MGLRGTAGTSHIDGCHAVFNAAKCTTEDSLAEGLLPGGEFGVHQEAKQLQVIGAPIVLQKTE